MPLAKFQNKHNNKPGFILGNGNTYQGINLESLKGQVTACVNVNPAPFDPTYWIFMDPITPRIKNNSNLMTSKSMKISRKFNQKQLKPKWWPLETPEACSSRR